MSRLEVREQLLQAVKVEAVLDEVRVDFAKDVVVLQIAEPLDPAALGVKRLFSFRHSIINFYLPVKS